MASCRNRLFADWPGVGRTGILVALFAGGLLPLHSQEGGVVAVLCPEGPACTDDALEIVFDSGSSTHGGPVEVGTEVPIQVVMDARSTGIQGFSYAVKHDPEFLSLIPESVTTAGTILDPESPGAVVTDYHFDASNDVPGGFISAVVLSLMEKREMPPGRNGICRATYRVTAKPECSVIRIVHHQLRVPGSPPVAVNITAYGRSLQPRTLRQGLVGAGIWRETCDDRADNDGNGLVDCEDPACPHLRCDGEEVCDDGVDNNSNGLVDCEDRRCLGKDPGCPGPEDCSDGIDNDRDGDLDCADAECDGSIPCLPPRENCQDGIDNDGDSAVDCDDGDCSREPVCRLPEVCNDGRDNDQDRFVDCDDQDCTGTPDCPIESSCDDGVDDDGDGLTDCDDSDCRWKVPCAEDCDDGIDNEGDGFVDRLDLECANSPPVIPAGMPVYVFFIRGDANGDGRVNVLDALSLIRFIGGEEQNHDCAAALNTNGDGGVDVSDALPLLRWIFLDGPPLPYPFPGCGYLIYGACIESSACSGG